MPHVDFPRQNDLETTFHTIIERYQLERETENRYRGSCPAHDSKSGNGFVVTLEPERILLYCHGECSFEEMVAALGYKLSDMSTQNHNSRSNVKSTSMPKPPQPRVMSEGGKTVTDFDYHDENSNVVYLIRRTDFADGRPKEIRPRIRIDGEWIPTLDERFRRYLYNLRGLLNAREQGEFIFFPEGEPKAQRLIDNGLNATCIAGGASGWTKYRHDYLRYFHGARVVLLPDNDEPGRKFVETVYADLKPICKDVIILPLPGLHEPKEDIIQWLDKYEYTISDLQELAVKELTSTTHSKAHIVSEETAYDLMRADIQPAREVVPGLLLEGTYLLASKKGSKKTMLALSTAVDVASGSMVLGKYDTEPGSVLYYALDDPRRRFRDRLRRMVGDDRSDEALKRLSIKYTAPRIDQGFLQDSALWAGF